MADDTELSLVLSRSVSANGKIKIGFGPGPNKDAIGPDSVRLGYSSLDGYGFNIWWSIIECEVFNNADYADWFASMKGTHMLLGFENSPTILSTDLTELANRLTGSGGYDKDRVQDAFFYTYVDWDGNHNANFARILAENAGVADNDHIDAFTRQTATHSQISIDCHY